LEVPYNYSTIATVNPSPTLFTDVGAIQGGNDQYDIYDLTADYSGGNTSETASSPLYDTAPTPPSSSPPAYNVYVSASLVRNATGRWQLMFAGLPANAQTIGLIWTDTNGISTTQNISAIVLTNGTYQIPDADVVNYLGDTVSVEGFDADSNPGPVAQAGVLPNDAPYFVDGRQHMKQNLNFLIRGASDYQPCFAEITEFREFFFQNVGLFFDPLIGEMNQYATNFEAFSFLHHGSWNGGSLEDMSYFQLDNLWPFTVNYDLANYFVDTTRTNLPYGSTNFSFNPNFATNTPAPPMLTHADPYWILQPGFWSRPDQFTGTNWNVTVTSTQTVASLASGGHNIFGLPYQTGCEVDMKQNGGAFSMLCLYQSLAPGSSVTANSSYLIGDYANWCPAPTLVLSNYYFAPLINPNANPMNLPGTIDYTGNNVVQYPTPLDDSFSIINQTPSLIIGAVGQPMILGGWAKYSIQGSSPTKYAYLGQYFVTNAFLLDGSGNITTNSAGIISPYGEFFPTQAGHAQLITMPDIDTGKQGTNLVQIISLNVDASHDGTMDLSYFGQDQTSPGKPYVFWCNNNFDRIHVVDGSDTEQDDMPPQSVPDYDYMADGNRAIPCARDLEDYSRLWINGVTSNLLATLPAGSTITLDWGDINSPNSSNPTIDLFVAADNDGGIAYLTNETVALEQTNLSQYPYVGRLSPGHSLQLNSSQFANNWAGNYFIWCGVTNGSGKLSLTFADASGRDLGQASVYIQILDIKQMYERWTVGDNTTQPPATTAYPAGDLPADMTQSFQYTTLAATNTPYILFVHGWNLPYWEKDRYAETAFKRLYWQGYQGRFGEFRWPTYFNFPFEAFQWQAIDLNNFDNSELNAWKSGTGLLNLLTSLNAQYPGQVYLTAHSMGNVVAGEALRLAGSSRVVNTYIAMQGAVSAHAYDPSTVNRTTSSLPDQYAHYWTNGAPSYFNGVAGAGIYVNFFNTNDYALNAAHWGLDQDAKPHLGYGYQPSGNFWYYGVTGLSYITADRYTIFAYCDPSLSYALGAQAGVGGKFSGNQVELDVPPYGFGNAHKFHSGEFRSDNAQRWQFWDEVLFQMGLKKNL